MTAHLRILHVCAVEYSARTLLLPQLSFLASQGHEVHLACAREGEVFDAVLEPFRPQHVPFPRTLAVGAIVRARREVTHVLQRVQPDIVHVHSPAAALVLRLCSRSVLRRQPVIYTVHGFAFQWDRRWISRDGLLLSLEHLFARRTDALLFQSREDLVNARRHKFPSRLIYLGNGVQDQWFDRASRPGCGRVRAVFVGRLVREKGVLDLLLATRDVRGIELTIVGSRISSERDDITGEIESLVNTPELAGRVTLMGHVGQQDLPGVLRDHDILILPSYREGVPRSIIEAMASGLPVVTTDIRGCRELVLNGVNGWVVPPGDVCALSRALAEVVELPVEERELLGQRGFELAAAEYRESEVFNRLQEAYATVSLGRCL